MSAWSPRNIMREMRRTRLLPVLAFYISAAVVVVQVTDIFVDRFGLPDWFFPGAMFLLVIGLPIVVATALVQAPPRAGASSSSALDGDAAGPAELGGARDRDAEMSPETGARVAAASSASGDEPAGASRAGPATSGLSSPRRHWLTWRKAGLAGAVAFAVWGLITGGFMLMRAMGIGPIGSLVAAGVIEMREPVLVADFQNRTPDPYLGGAVTEAFRVDLARSEIVTLVESDRVRAALERMNRAPDLPLDAELAREVALREGIKAIVAGDISAAGTGYVLSARLLATEGGEILRAARSEAVDASQVISAIDQLSRQLREQIGESFSTLRRGEPLERVTTASLDALYRYSRGMRALDIQSDVDRGILLLQEAVALDSTFAMAYRRLGMALRNRGDIEEGNEALTRAYAHRHRLTEEERYLTIAGYYSYPGNDMQRAIRAYEALLDLVPDHRIALNNLAILHGVEGDQVTAIDLLRRVVERHPRESRTPYGNLIPRLIQRGELDEAAALVARMAEHFTVTPMDRVTAANIAFSRWRFDEAIAEWEAAAASAGRDAELRRGAHIHLAGAAAAKGRLSEAARLLEEATDAGADPDATRPMDRLTLAWMRMMVGPAEEAVRLLDALLEDDPLQPDQIDAAFASTALYAAAGRPEQARRLLDRYDAISSQPFDQALGPQASITHALIAAAEGQPADAIPALRELAEQCPACGAPMLSAAYDAMGEPDSAAAYARRFFEPAVAPTMDPFVAWLGPAILRVAEAEEAAGDTARALEYYTRFLELWADADAEFQPRVADARRRLQALGADPPPDR